MIMCVMHVTPKCNFQTGSVQWRGVCGGLPCKSTLQMVDNNHLILNNINPQTRIQQDSPLTGGNPASTYLGSLLPLYLHRAQKNHSGCVTHVLAIDAPPQ